MWAKALEARTVGMTRPRYGAHRKEQPFESTGARRNKEPESVIPDGAAFVSAAKAEVHTAT